MDEARDLVPVVGAVFQAGPPAYALVGLGAVITLLACSPLMILGAVLMISLVVTALLAAVVVAPVLVVRRVRASSLLGGRPSPGRREIRCAAASPGRPPRWG